MIIRNAKTEELAEIQSVFGIARSFMRANGNDVQWVNGYPSDEVLLNDIKKGMLYVAQDDGEIVGVFTCGIMDDETYHVIEGSWKNDTEYAVVHRVATKYGSRGIGSFILSWAESNYNHIRIDTHELNKPMQGLVKKFGYDYCGIIYVSDGTPRLAFEKSL